MNLVAKEFVAARADEDGVLILSQFTGASRELRDALLVNPYDIERWPTRFAGRSRWARASGRAHAADAAGRSRAQRLSLGRQPDHGAGRIRVEKPGKAVVR